MPSLRTLVLLPILALPLSLLVVVLGKAVSRVTARTVRAFARANFAWPTGSSFFYYSSRQHGKMMSLNQCAQELSIRRYKKRGDEQAVECVFCLGGIEEGEETRELKCRHLFHRGCLDRWLARPRATCPLCRDRLLTVPFVDMEEEEEDMDMVFMAYVHRGRRWWQAL